MTNATAIQKQQPNQMTPKQEATALQAMLESRKDSIMKLLPKHLTPERMVQAAILARSRNPKLMECTAQSFLAAFMKCAEMGLEPSGAVGGCWLVPRRNNKTGEMEANAEPDYRGLLEIARRSGEIQEVSAEVIHVGDDYDVRMGTDGYIKHAPDLEGVEGDVICVYAVAKFKGGGHQFVVLTKPTVEKVRARSTAKDAGPWKTDWEEMAKKTAVKRLCKLLPRGRELAAALDDSHDVHDPELVAAIVEAAPAPALRPASTKAEGIKQQLRARNRVIDQQAGESEAQAEARHHEEPPTPTEEREPGSDG